MAARVPSRKFEADVAAGESEAAGENEAAGGFGGAANEADGASMGYGVGARDAALVVVVAVVADCLGPVKN